MKNIFICDDNSSILRLYTNVFKMSGYEVETASDGEGAEEKLLAKNFKPDVILLDVMMPKADGFEVLQKIKSNKDLKDIPVIVLTNLESLTNIQADLDRARSIGAVAVIIKSQTDPKDVVAMAENLSIKHE